MLIPVTARRPFQHEGRTVAPGDQLQLTPQLALAYQYRGKVRLARRRRRAVAAAVTTEPTPDDTSTPITTPRPRAKPGPKPSSRRAAPARHTYRTTELVDRETTVLTPPDAEPESGND